MNDHNSNLILFGFRITKRILEVNKRVVLKSWGGGMNSLMGVGRQELQGF